jgi:hypothetical protein
MHTVSGAEYLEPQTAHSMQDTLRMKIFQSREDLFSEILRDGFFETTIFT